MADGKVVCGLALSKQIPRNGIWELFRDSHGVRPGVRESHSANSACKSSVAKRACAALWNACEPRVSFGFGATAKHKLCQALESFGLSAAVAAPAQRTWHLSRRTDCSASAWPSPAAILSRQCAQPQTRPSFSTRHTPRNQPAGRIQSGRDRRRCGHAWWTSVNNRAMRTIQEQRVAKFLVDRLRSIFLAGCPNSASVQILQSLHSRLWSPQEKEFAVSHDGRLERH